MDGEVFGAVGQHYAELFPVTHVGYDEGFAAVDEVVDIVSGLRVEYFDGLGNGCTGFGVESDGLGLAAEFGRYQPVVVGDVFIDAVGGTECGKHLFA